MFSDLIQGNMQNDMQGQIKAGTKQIFDRLVTQGMPQAIADRILSNIPDAGENADPKASTSTSPNIPGITKWVVTSLCGKVSCGWILPPS